MQTDTQRVPALSVLLDIYTAINRQVTLLGLLDLSAPFDADT